MFFLKKKRRLHFGKRRIKVDFFLSVKNICFLSNDYFIRNTFYSLFFEGDKANNIRSKDNLLFSSSEIRYILIDDVLKFSATLYIDNDIESSMRQVSGTEKFFDPKDRKIIIRQKTFLQPDEIVYRDVGYITLSLDKLVQSQTKAAYSFPIVDPGVSGYVQASIVCKFAKEEDAELVGRIIKSNSPSKHLSSRSLHLTASASPQSEPLFLYSEIFKESIDMHCLREQCRSQSSPPNLSPLLRISSDDDRFVSSWMQRQQQRRSQKALPPGQINMSYIVDLRLASADQQDMGDGDDDDDDDDDTGNMDEDDPRDRSWNSIGQQKKHFICPSTVPEGDELDGESMVILESEFDKDWRISYNKSFINAYHGDDDIDDGAPAENQFDKEWNLSSLNKKFISTIVELDENEDYRLEETDSDWNMGKIKTNFLPPRGSEEEEEMDYASHEVDREWSGISGLKKVFVKRFDTRTNGTVSNTEDNDEDSDFGELETDYNANQLQLRVSP